jgi:hypothetical protein
MQHHKDAPDYSWPVCFNRISVPMTVWQWVAVHAGGHISVDTSAFGEQKLLTSRCPRIEAFCAG